MSFSSDLLKVATAVISTGLKDIGVETTDSTVMGWVQKLIPESKLNTINKTRSNKNQGVIEVVTHAASLLCKWLGLELPVEVIRPAVNVISDAFGLIGRRHKRTKAMTPNQLRILRRVNSKVAGYHTIHTL